MNLQKQQFDVKKLAFPQRCVAIILSQPLCLSMSLTSQILCFPFLFISIKQTTLVKKL